MRLYHGTRRENAISIIRDGFEGSKKTTFTDGFTTFGREEGVVFFTDSLEYAKEYAQNEGDIIIIVEIEKEFIHSVSEIDPNYFNVNEEQFINVIDVNDNAKIVGIIDNNIFINDTKEWAF